MRSLTYLSQFVRVFLPSFSDNSSSSVKIFEPQWVSVKHKISKSKKLFLT